MNTIQKVGLFVFIFCAMGLQLPYAKIQAQAYKTVSGSVTQIVGSQVYFKTSSAMVYRAEIGAARLLRKNGAPMQFNEIMVGDKVEVKGTLWGDASISADYIRNMSLYTHTSTFTGKISAINPLNQTFTIQSKQNGEQLIKTDNFTTYKKNGKSATFKDLELQYTTSIKGQWDRSNTNVLAKEVNATYRLVSINITGTVLAKTDNGITVSSSGIMYGVNISKAQLESKNGKQIVLSDVSINDAVRIQGKHISESPKIEATTVKDLSLSK